MAEGRDFVHGVSGRFFAWQCAHCGLQFQNPRPTVDCLPQLYPATYGPHGGTMPNGKISPCPATWRERLKHRPLIRSVWPFLHQTRSILRAVHSRTSTAFLRFLYSRPTAWETFLREELGYSHLQPSAPSTGCGLGWLTRRACRRLAGLDLVPRYAPNGRLLEIGCAIGDRLCQLRDWGWKQLEGIELVEKAAVQAQQRGFLVNCESVETALNRYPDGYFDVVVSSMVLEHLYNPFAVTRVVARKLRAGGEFLFSTVTRDALDARFFGRYWGGYDFPRHMVYLRMSDIRQMVHPDFELLEWFHHNAPIDFVRSTTWRLPEGRLSDRVIAWLTRSPAGMVLGDLLARMGQTCRVSFRCRRKA